VPIEITKKDAAFIARAATVAARAVSRKHRVGAVLVRAGKVLATAHNIVALFSSTGERCYDKHAEVRTLTKRRYHEGADLAGAVVYVARLRRDRAHGMARPCASCEAALRACGISAVYYTTDIPGMILAEEYD
jgi:deoxycytidylate deaminase